MKLAARLAVALAVLALAAPALACGGDKHKTADAPQAKPAVASVEKAPAKTKADANAKKAEARPATAQN
jgi:hypothetical protein